METKRIKIKVNNQASNRINKVTKGNKVKVRVSKMVPKVIRDNRIKEVNKVLVKIRTEDKPADRCLRIIRTVIRLDKEMLIILKMDRDNSNLRVVSKINRVELVRMVSSNSKVVNKEISLEMVKVRADSLIPGVMGVSKVKARMVEIILMAIMTERKLLRML